MIRFALSYLCFAAVALAADSTPTVASGQPAPDFAFTDSAGQKLRLSDLRGRVVVLEWLTPACPYVQRHYRSGNLPATQTFAAGTGAVWLQLNSNAIGDLDPQVSADWQKKQGVVARAYIRDRTGEIGRRYGALTTPHLYVIDRAGTLVYQGAIDDQPSGSVATAASARNFIKETLTALQAGQPVAVSTTKPYGCHIKYGAD